MGSAGNSSSGNPSGTKKEVDSVTPTRFSDVENIVRKLKRKEGVIVDFESIPPHIAQRMLDFLSGAVFALNGEIKRIKSKMYILIPDGVKISTVKGV